MPQGSRKSVEENNEMSKKTSQQESTSNNNHHTAGNEDRPLEVYVLDHCTERYPIVRVAVDWSHILKKKQEFQHLRPNELLDMALKDVLSGKVNLKTIAEELEALQKKATEEEAQASAAAKLKLKEKDKGEEEDLETVPKEGGKKKKASA